MGDRSVRVIVLERLAAAAGGGFALAVSKSAAISLNREASRDLQSAVSCGRPAVDGERAHQKAVIHLAAFPRAQHLLGTPAHSVSLQDFLLGRIGSLQADGQDSDGDVSNGTVGVAEQEVQVGWVGERQECIPPKAQQAIEREQDLEHGFRRQRPHGLACSPVSQSQGGGQKGLLAQARQEQVLGQLNQVRHHGQDAGGACCHLGRGGKRRPARHKLGQQGLIVCEDGGGEDGVEGQPGEGVQVDSVWGEAGLGQNSLGVDRQLGGQAASGRQKAPIKCGALHCGSWSWGYGERGWVGVVLGFDEKREERQEKRDQKKIAMSLVTALATLAPASLSTSRVRRAKQLGIPAREQRDGSGMARRGPWLQPQETPEFSAFMYMPVSRIEVGSDGKEP